MKFKKLIMTAALITIGMAGYAQNKTDIRKEEQITNEIIINELAKPGLALYELTVQNLKTIQLVDSLDRKVLDPKYATLKNILDSTNNIYSQYIKDTINEVQLEEGLYFIFKRNSETKKVIPYSPTNKSIEEILTKQIGDHKDITAAYAALLAYYHRNVSVALGQGTDRTTGEFKRGSWIIIDEQYRPKVNKNIPNPQVSQKTPMIIDVPMELDLVYGDSYLLKHRIAYGNKKIWEHYQLKK